MAAEFKENTIKYLGKDFQSLKRNLIEYTQAHQSGAIQDYNETSPGMALLELVAYVGDVLSFYQDQQFEELKQVSARQIENVTEFAKSLGYRPAGKRPSRGIETVMVEVPSTTRAGAIVPDDTYTPVLRAGSKLAGPNGVIFETLSDVHFSASVPTEDTNTYRLLTGSRFDSNTGLPTHFAIRKDVPVIAGETKTDTVYVSSFQPFREIELSEPDVIEIVSVSDSDGNSWNEVDFLVQEHVFDGVVNESSDSSVVPYTMKLRTVPRRFIVDRDPLTEKTSLIFGSGDGLNFDDELVPNVADFALPINGRRSFSSYSIDPQNFLRTRTLGLSPFNTTLTIDYRVGGGPQTNVPAGTVRSFIQADLDFSSTSLSPTIVSDVRDSIECINKTKIEGGASAESITEIKANAGAFHAAQNRAVTREDYIARLFSLPTKFGKISKAFVTKDIVNETALNIHLLSSDENGNLTQATDTLVRNAKTYLSRYRMMTEGVNLLQTDIINLRLNFGVVISPKFTRSEVLAKCLQALKDEFIDPVDGHQLMQPQEPIVLSRLSQVLQNVIGVVSVYDMRVTNVFGNYDGLDYADNLGNSVRFDVQSNTKNGIIYCPSNSIFQVKFPNKDISGESK